MLEEAIRVLAPPKKTLTNALQLDVAAVDAIKRMANSIQGLGQTPADVCGVWAAITLLPVSTLAKASDKSLVDENMVSYASGGESEDLPSSMQAHTAACEASKSSHRRIRLGYRRLVGLVTSPYVVRLLLVTPSMDA